VVRRIQVPPGKYQLRIGARESGGGKVGTVIYDLDAPDFSKGNLTMSGIALASAAGSRFPTASPDPSVNEFKDVLPSPPSASREFPRQDQLAVFAEVYDNDVKTPHIVDITTTVLSEDGRNVFKSAEERPSSELQGKPGGYGHQARINLKDFTPGIYLLTIEAKSRAGNKPPVGRTVQFKVQ